MLVGKRGTDINGYAYNIGPELELLPYYEV